MVPFRLFVGGNELSELQRQSSAFAEAAAAGKLPVNLSVLRGHDHFSILDELSEPEGQIARELASLADNPARS